MGSYLEVHVALVRVPHRPANLHRVGLDAIGNFQFKPIRVCFQLAFANHPHSPATHLFKLPVAGKAMLFHGASLAVDTHSILKRFAHRGKQYRCMTVPVGGIAIPQVLPSRLLQAQQLCPVGRDLDGYLVIFEFHLFYRYWLMCRWLSASKTNFSNISRRFIFIFPAFSNLRLFFHHECS